MADAIWEAVRAGALERLGKVAPLAKYQQDPVGFARDVLGVRLWGRQAEILRHVAASVSARVAVRSGHKVGKSKTAAVLAFWFAACFPKARVVMTSSSGRQVKDILWREIRDIWRGLKAAARELLGCVEPAVDPGTGLLWPDGREIKGFTTDNPERMAGYSGENILFILDEASGIERPIFEAIEGNRAGGARVVMFSNPTQTAGEFFDAFHDKRHLYACVHISSEETPNVTGDGPPIPGLAGPEWIAEKLAEWGEDSPLYQVRVRGNFPTQGSTAVVSISAVDSARKRWEEAGPPHWSESRLHLGVDVARFGDDESVIVPRRGRWAWEPRAVAGFDTVAVAGKVLEVAREMRDPGEKHKPLVKVDGIGIGAGVVDILRQHSWIDVVDVNVSERSDEEDMYPNLRSQLWFGLADWLLTGAIPDDSRMAGEMTAPTYSFDLRGRRKVVEKSEMKRKLGRSPDRAEALMLAVYEAHASLSEDDVAALLNDDATRWGDMGRGF